VTHQLTKGISTHSDTSKPTLPPTIKSLSGIGEWFQNHADIVLTALLAALGTLFVVYFQKVVAAFNKGVEWVWKRLKVERASEALYCKNLAKELRAIQILRMAEAKDLEAIYIPLKLAEWVSPELREACQISNKDILSLSEALDKFERLTIVGDPGSGKTTITSYAAAALADHNSQINNKKIFPVHIQLRQLKEFLEDETEKDKSLKELIVEVLAPFDFPNARKFLDRKLVDGVCLIVLDGFDELADQTGILQQRLAKKVGDFIASVSSGNRVVLTSRAAGYEPAWFPGFRVLEMTELTLPQIKHFVAGWFGKPQVKHGKSLQIIIDTNERLQLLVTNPLMLAIVCFVYGAKDADNNFLPQRRVDLYDRCIEALVIEWDRSRGINREPRFTPRQIEMVLSHVAYEALAAEKIDFSRKELLSLIRTYMPRADLRQYDDEIFLKEILEHTGLFKEKAHDTIGFIHLTFQEYLAAQIIAEKVLRGVEMRDVRAEIGDVMRNLANPRWAEPITLAAGILRGRTELVTVLNEECKARTTKELRLLVAGCLRDADLNNLDFAKEYLVIQDERLSDLVEIALIQESI